VSDKESGEDDLEARHHASHHGLLHSATPSGRAPVDGIIIPTCRDASNLAEATRIAEAVGAPLLLLCSQDSVPAEAARVTAGVRSVVVDANAVPEDVVPDFETTKLLAGTDFCRGTDTSRKRNLGLLLARLAGWRRVVLLDDDIRVPRPDDLRVAAGLLDSYDGVGLAIGGFPDNSVVCHAYRDAGNEQRTFVGTGALVIAESMLESFFPDIYNEDWFFLLDDTALRPTTVVGEAIQRAYDPYANPQRARTEELGDCLAEGLFTLLDQGRTLSDADHAFWERFVADRRKLIIKTVEQIGLAGRDVDMRTRINAALEAARQQSERITPGQCVDYLAAWQRDRAMWRQHVRDWTERANGSDLPGLVGRLRLSTA
jgi:hypothetical protein